MSSPVREPVAHTSADVFTEHPAPLARLGQVLVLIAGAVLVISGAITLAKTGLDGDLSNPVVEVMGNAHTPWLGIAELVAGVFLIAAGASAWNREMGVVVGVLLLVTGFVFLSDPTLAPDDLSIDDGYGWFLVIVGAIATIGGLLPGGRVTRRTQQARTR